MTRDGLLREIEAEAERIRHDGSLPRGFEAHLAEVFSSYASDPRALQDEVAVRGAPSSARPSDRAVRFVRRALGAARRRVGPPVRRVERRLVERSRAASASAARRRAVLLDRLERQRAVVLARSLTDRLSTKPPLPPPSQKAVRVLPDGRLESGVLDAALLEAIGTEPGEVLVAESGDGSLVARLGERGGSVHGVDPHHGRGPERRSALEALSRSRPESLGAVVLVGVPEQMTPARAAVACRLVSSRLFEGGIVVVVSSHPDALESADPVASDLASARPLRPVTWSHLLSAAGLRDVRVTRTPDDTAYLLTARRGPGR